MSTSPSKSAVLLLMLATLAVVTACREEEQDRILFEDKGVYQGQTDQPLSQEQIDALRQRATQQRI